LCGALCAALCACAVGPDYHAPVLDAPEGFRAAAPASNRDGAASRAPEISRWWHALGDQQLDALVVRALDGNPDLDVALQRLQQARMIELAVTGTALPRLEAAAGGARGSGSDLTRGRLPSALGAADHTLPGGAPISQIAGADAFWELDIFGHLRRQIEAARYDAQAAAAARDAVQIAVIADVVRAYVDLRGLQMQLAVAQQNARTARSLLDIVEARFERGITNELDATLARRQLATVLAQLPPLRSQVDAQRYALAVLLGLYPRGLDTELDAPGPVPPVPEEIAPGLPLDLLRRRPDVRAAEWQLAGATARIGVATADLFPRLGLNAGIGTEGVGQTLHPDHHQSIWSAGYVAYFPLLDFGVLDAVAEVADLHARETLALYRRTVLHAVQEVDAAISAYQAQQEGLTDLQDAVLASGRAVTLSTQRYERGLTDFLNVVDAQRRAYELEGQFVAAQTASADQFVALYRALGGGWEQYAGPPRLRTPQPALVAMLRRLVDPSAGLP
jgi:NodT family efflux transporter outer membrane factor (OMF) lipoprotein